MVIFLHPKQMATELAEWRRALPDAEFQAYTSPPTADMQFQFMSMGPRPTPADFKLRLAEKAMLLGG